MVLLGASDGTNDGEFDADGLILIDGELLELTPVEFDGAILVGRKEIEG